jgi:hypothetical protein
MKYLFVLLIFFSLKNGLQAQVTDSTTMNADSARAGNMNNNMNSPSTRADSSNTSISNGMNSMNKSSNSTMSNTSSGNGNMVGTMLNTMNTKGVRGYAALPVMESYIPGDVMDKIKSKYGNGSIIYDVTAVRAAMPTDSAMQSKDSSSMQQPQADSVSAMPMTAAPVKYNYVVRTIKDGAIQTECVADDGTTAVMPNEMNKPQQ